MNLDDVVKLLDEINADRSVPKNIRLSLEKAIADLNDTGKDMAVRIDSAISIMDEISNDPNIPIYTRTQIWNIVSRLEIMNEMNKRQQNEK